MDNKLDIVKLAVADLFDIEFNDLDGNRKYIDLVTARRFVYYILNQDYDFSVDFIATEFYKTKTSVIFGIRHISRWLRESDQARADYFEIINKIEEHASNN